MSNQSNRPGERQELAFSPGKESHATDKENETLKGANVPPPGQMFQGKLDALSQILSALKDATAAMIEAYRRLPDVMDREHTAIRTTKLETVRATAEEKAALGEAIEAAFSAMNAAGEGLRDPSLWKDMPLGSHPICSGPITLDVCVEALTVIASTLGQDFRAQVFRHQLSLLKSSALKLREMHKLIKPKIELNKLVCAAMLESVTESYRFWQDITEAAASAYDHKGQQHARGRLSGFRARV